MDLLFFSRLLGWMLGNCWNGIHQVRQKLFPPYRDVNINIQVEDARKIQVEDARKPSRGFVRCDQRDEVFVDHIYNPNGEQKPWLAWLAIVEDPPSEPPQEFTSSRN